MFKMASKRFLFIALAFATALLVTSEIVAARELASNNENALEDAKHDYDDNYDNHHDKHDDDHNKHDHDKNDHDEAFYDHGRNHNHDRDDHDGHDHDDDYHDHDRNHNHEKDDHDIAMVDMEGTTMVGVTEAGIAGMVVVVTEISIIEDVGVALLFKRQSHTNKLMRHKLTIDLSMLS
ncbi:hypothetical protein E3N88_34472 [Mikania micrantha]|uniref:Uncharacterized protein n=1 Tax=Mikania micrantha TaxID=192012 RepID=A0A5N6LYL5_9ASTR|nr:hypothetical protein E3N88_34472 [Mikania micrantha]